MSTKVRPMFIRKKDGLKKVRGVFQRESIAAPVNYYTTWLDESGVCKVGVSPLAAPTNVQTLLLTEGVQDCDIALDGSWKTIQSEGFRLITQGLPYLATINSAGQLLVEQLGEPSVTFEGNYSHTAMVRGWKHQSDSSIDQGLLIFASLKDTPLIEVYAYKQVASQMAWTKTMDIATSGIPTGLTAKLLTDFRWALTVDYGESSQMLISDRTYVSQAVRPESVTLKAINRKTGQNTIIPVQRVKLEHADKDVVVLKALARQSSYNTVTSLVPLKNVWAYNTGGTLITMLWDQRLFYDESTTLETLLSGFSITDSAGINIGKTNIVFLEYGVSFECTDFNNAEGDITVTYVGNYLKWGLGQLQGQFSATFSPEGLKPVAVDPPLPIKAYRVEVIIDDQV